MRNARRQRAAAEATKKGNKDAATTDQLVDLIQTLNKRFQGDATGADKNLEPITKKQKLDTWEFNEDGSLATPAQYEGMNFSGMTYHEKVSDYIRQKIMRNQHFDIKEMLNESDFVDLLTGLTRQTSISKPEIFECLYIFGMYYLQKYPGKTAGFLEYLVFLQHQAVYLTAPGLVKLESSLRRHYLANPSWNWTQDHPKLNKVWDEIRSNPNYVKFNPMSPTPLNKARIDTRGHRSTYRPRERAVSEGGYSPPETQQTRKKGRSVATGTGGLAPGTIADSSTRVPSAEGNTPKTDANDKKKKTKKKTQKTMNILMITVKKKTKKKTKLD